LYYIWLIFIAYGIKDRGFNLNNEELYNQMEILARRVNVIRIYFVAVLSIIALLFYFLPWIVDAHTALGFYILAFLWFMFVWIPLLIHIILFVKLKIAKNIKSKHHLIASILILIIYGILFIGVSNNYVLTV
jgi:hypothetical protein